MGQYLFIVDDAGSPLQGKTTLNELRTQMLTTSVNDIVIGSDSGTQITKFGYPLHVSADSGGHGLYVGPEDEGDNDDHPALLSTSELVTSDLVRPRAAHLERTYQADQSGNIIGCVNTTKFSGTASYTQGSNTTGFSSQLEGDNANLTITNGFQFKANNPTAVSDSGSPFAGTITNLYGVYVEEMDQGGTNYAIYTEDNNEHRFGGKLTSIADATGSNRCLQSEYYSDSAGSGSNIVLQKAGNTEASPAAVSSSDLLASIQFRGYDTNSAFTQAAQIRAEADGTIGSGIVPGKLILRTASTAGTLTDRLSIDTTGDVEILTVGKGLIVPSADGTRYRLTPANDGLSLVITAV